MVYIPSFVSLHYYAFLVELFKYLQEERLKRLKHRMKVLFDASRPDHQVCCVLIILKDFKFTSEWSHYKFLTTNFRQNYFVFLYIVVRFKFNFATSLIHYKNSTRLGSIESSMVRNLPRSGASWLDIWSMERNGMARKRSIDRFQVKFTVSTCLLLRYFVFCSSHATWFSWLKFEFFYFNRGAGFISLENLLFFAKTFSVRQL